MMIHWLGAAVLASTASALQLDINDPQSIKDAAATASFNMMSNYMGNHTGGTPGYIPQSYSTGAQVFATLIDYWYYTGDGSNNAAVQQGMYWQRGGNNDYMPTNYSAFMSNDDQIAWGLAAMRAAEVSFPAEDDKPSWTTLAANVFDDLAQRWDTDNCGGGLHWQPWPYQAGYMLKSALVNGGFFELAARLGLQTDNQTYVQWAEKVWDWSVTVGLVRNDTWAVKDSTDVADDCGKFGALQWTINYASYLGGAASMYKLTHRDAKWKSGVSGLLNSTLKTFFPQKYGGGDVMTEVVCEPIDTCAKDQVLFKGKLAFALAFTSAVAPYTAADILPKLKSSAVAAAKQCSGGANQTLCGRRWYQAGWDGTANMQEQVSATSLFASNLVQEREAVGATSATSETSDNNSAGNETSAAGQNEDSKDNGSRGMGVSSVALVVGLVVCQLVRWA